MKNDVNIAGSDDKLFLTEKYLYISDKERLINLVRGMADEAIKSLFSAVESLDEADGAKAESVIERDDVIDDMEEKIDQECLYTIATRQPMREDLRFIYAVTKIITDLERIGDQSENIANCSLSLLREGKTKESLYFRVGKPASEEILSMRSRIETMFKKSIAAFIDEDENAARATMEMSREFSLTGEKAVNALAAFAANGNLSEVLHVFTNVLWIVKYLERVAGHVMNIAEWVCFIATGVSPVTIKKKAKKPLQSK